MLFRVIRFLFVIHWFSSDVSCKRYSLQTHTLSHVPFLVWTSFTFEVYGWDGWKVSFLTLRLLMSYIYGAPSKARNANVVYIWTFVWQR